MNHLINKLLKEIENEGMRVDKSFVKKQLTIAFLEGKIEGASETLGDAFKQYKVEGKYEL